MADPIQELLAAGVLPTDSLPGTSRYRDVGIATYGEQPDAVAYYRRRLCRPRSATACCATSRCARATGATCSRTPSSATRPCGGVWPTLRECSTTELEQPAGRWVRVTLAADPRPQSATDGGPEDA